MQGLLLSFLCLLVVSFDWFFRPRSQKSHGFEKFKREKQFKNGIGNTSYKQVRNPQLKNCINQFLKNVNKDRVNNEGKESDLRGR